MMLGAVITTPSRTTATLLRGSWELNAAEVSLLHSVAPLLLKSSWTTHSVLPCWTPEEAVSMSVPTTLATSRTYLKVPSVSHAAYCLLGSS